MLVNINFSMNLILNSSSRKPISLSVSGSVRREFRSIRGCTTQSLFPNSICKRALIVTHSDAVVLILSLWAVWRCRKLTGHLCEVSETEAILSREIKLGSIPRCLRGGWSLFPHCRGLFIEGEGRAAAKRGLSDTRERSGYDTACRMCVRIGRGAWLLLKHYLWHFH